MPEHFFDALSSNIFPWPISPVSSVIAPNHISPELSNDFQKTEMNPAHANSALVEELKASLKDSTVVTPESESYEKSIERWSEAAERKAGVIVFVKSERDISTTLLLSKKYGTEIAVSGGKHSSSGASSTTGGLVIDLAEMHGVVVDAEKKTLSVQGGAVWKDVDDAAAVHGLATVGGTVNHTGVGGLTLGGGYGWLSGRYGLTIDNLLEVKMILANGTLVTASENINPDLFWAVRGAGQCFGVVVEFTFQAFPQAAPIWAGQMLFSAEKHLDAIVEFANKFVERNDCDAAMAVGITAPPMLKEIAINTSVFYNGTEEAGKALFEPLMRLNPIMNNVHVRPYSEVNGMLNHLVPYGRSKLSKGASFVAPLRPEFIRSLVTALETIHREVPDSKRTLLNLEFHSPDLWCKVPRTATSFANRGRHQNILIMPMWSDQKYNDRVRLWAREVAAMFAAELDRIRKELGNPKDMVNITEYANYDCLMASSKDVYGANFERLVELKKRFDGDNVFRKSYQLLPSA